MTLGALASNSGFLAYPIATQARGPVAVIALALCVFVENPFVIPVGLALIDGGKLLLHPLCVLLMPWPPPPMDPEFGTATVLCATMSFMGLYAVLPRRHGLATSCQAALLVATVASFFSVSVLIATTPALTRWLR